MSSTSAARFNPLLAAAASVEFSIAALHIAHWASAGSAAASISPTATARINNVCKVLILKTNPSARGLPFVLDLLYRLNRSHVMQSKAVREEYSKQAQQHDNRRHDSEDQTQPLELQVHEVSDDQRGLYDRCSHKDDHHQRQRNLYVREENLEGGQPEQNAPHVNVLAVASAMLCVSHFHFHASFSNGFFGERILQHAIRMSPHQRRDREQQREHQADQNQKHIVGSRPEAIRKHGPRRDAKRQHRQPQQDHVQSRHFSLLRVHH